MTNTETKKPLNAPTHIAYYVREGKETKFWNRIGVAFAHKDGKGFNIQIDSVPFDGKITLRSMSEEQ